MWIFGYGSLVWKPSFEYTEKISGYVKGYKRRFWQGSKVHRGVPESPGRVVTLIPSENDHVWGVCYRVSEEHVEQTLNYLDHREREGYARDKVMVYKHFEDESPILTDVLVYTATEANEDFLGETDELIIAHEILTRSGPSGTNLEYFMNLLMTLKENNVEDEHLLIIEKHIKTLRSSKVNSEEAETSIPVKEALKSLT